MVRSLPVLSADEMLDLFDYLPLIEWLEVKHTEHRASLDDIYMEATTEGTTNGFLVRPAWAPGSGLGVKLASVFPENRAKGLPTVHGVYVLFDGLDGRPRAVMDGTVLTWFKTACDSALGSRLLARSDSSHLAMIGAGAMAPHLIRAHLSVRPTIERVTIWNRTSANAHTLAESLDGEADVAVSADLEDAVRAADLISCATMSEEPLIRGEWLRPGTHLDLVGAYLPSMREADDEAIGAGRLFVDSRETTVDAIGELMIPIARGVITEADVLGDLYELCAGDVEGRLSDDAITIFKNGGGGHLDLMTAQFAAQQVR